MIILKLGLKYLVYKLEQLDNFFIDIIKYISIVVNFTKN